MLSQVDDVSLEGLGYYGLGAFPPYQGSRPDEDNLAWSPRHEATKRLIELGAFDRPTIPNFQ